MSSIDLRLGDCLEVLKSIPDSSIDLVVTDPPYLMNYKTRRRKDKTHDFCTPIYGDNNALLVHDAITELYRVLKANRAMYMFCNSNKVDYFKNELETAGFIVKNIIIWVKNSHTAGDLQAAYGKQYEMVFLVNKGRCKINGKRLTDVWYFNKVAGKKQMHQNQKPVALIERCVDKSSSCGDIVLDPFMGSGTTGVACKRLKRDFIGIEIDQNYFATAKERIDKTDDESDRE